MINKTYQDILTGLMEEIMALTEKKAHDYARETDTLSNFKVQAAMQSALFEREVKGSDIAFQFILVKLARLANLRSKDPQNESVRDTILDLINYVGLYHACRLDESPVAFHPKGSRKFVDNVSTTMPGCIVEEIVR